MHTLGLIGNLGNWELMGLLLLGLLLFGRRLPEVGRSLGKGIVEFKRGLRDIQTDIDVESSKPGPTPFEPAANRGSITDGGAQQSVPQSTPAERVETGEPATGQ
jgi:sec-independent protein translocase protein TatA